jgi:hypothetical protein
MTMALLDTGAILAPLGSTITTSTTYAGVAGGAGAGPGASGCRAAGTGAVGRGAGAWGAVEERPVE